MARRLWGSDRSGLPLWSGPARADLGDAESPFGSVHIRYKTEVGERLALAGRRVAYGEDVCSGPVFNRLRVVDGSIDVEFNATSCGGLVLSTMNLTKAEDQGNWTG